jgi:acyl-CoA reductase-like NAD-dependent aldehyde dehydrogenase
VDPEEVRDFPEAPSGPAKIKTIVRRQPAGVVGIIVPWNVPQGIVAVKRGAGRGVHRGHQARPGNPA